MRRGAGGVRTVPACRPAVQSMARRGWDGAGALGRASSGQSQARGAPDPAASGLPWYAIMVLPLLFACGMSLLDCLDGLFMSVACDWAFLNPVRKVYDNISITGLSVAV